MTSRSSNGYSYRVIQNPPTPFAKEAIDSPLSQRGTEGDLRAPQGNLHFILLGVLGVFDADTAVHRPGLAGYV